ncbi:unnamed protein product [Lota lota]
MSPLSAIFTPDACCIYFLFPTTPADSRRGPQPPPLTGVKTGSNCSPRAANIGVQQQFSSADLEAAA